MKQDISNKELIIEIKSLIEQSKQQLAVAVNATLSMLYWQIGKRIKEKVLINEKATYGKAVIENLSNQLTLDYGTGWSKKQLLHCLYVVETFQDFEKFSTVCRQLSWSHIKIIMYMEDSLKREFYIEMCKIEKWSVRVLQERIQSMLYERTAISKKPELTIQNDLEQLKNEQKISADLVFKDPYVLEVVLKKIK